MPDGASLDLKTRLGVSGFNVFVPSAKNDVVLCLNTFKGSFFPLSVSDFEVFGGIIAAVEDEKPLAEFPQSMIKIMHDYGFLIEQEFDERDAIRHRYFNGRDKEKNLKLTIAPTVSCNFACSYCFEEHPKRHMSQDDIEALGRYVDTALDPGETLSITWFGGEPLAQFNSLKKLDALFTDICRAKGSRYHQSIITNGSLLSESRIQYFAGREGFSSAQLTLDGPPDIHDQRRVTSAGGETFSRIMKNIKAVNSRFYINVRVNLDARNVNRITELIDLIADADVGHYVGLYFGHVANFNDTVGGLDDHCLTRRAFADAEAKLSFYMLQKGLRPSVSLPVPYAGSICVADAKGGAVLSPGGMVFNCWNETAFPEGKESGRYETGEIVRDPEQKLRSERWKDYDPFAHSECQTCKVMPVCKGGCPWEAAKAPKEGPGHCTSLRYNLSDRLRLHYICSQIDASAEIKPDRPRQII